MNNGASTMPRKILAAVDNPTAPPTARVRSSSHEKRAASTILPHPPRCQERSGREREREPGDQIANPGIDRPDLQEAHVPHEHGSSQEELFLSLYGGQDPRRGAQ